MTTAAYFDELPDERKAPMLALRKVIADNLPAGFEERICYNMPSFVVPHSLYPAGYHCDPKTPLPFLSIASQKNFIALYHMGLYADKAINDWFVAEYPKYVKNKLDMGKGCVRFKNVSLIPYELIGQLVAKMSMQEWIERYESTLKKD